MIYELIGLLIMSMAVFFIGFIIGIATDKRTSTCRKKDECFEIIERSNIVQYDDFGNPLRLCIVKISKDPRVPLDQMWLDSYHEKSDVECIWRKKQ